MTDTQRTGGRRRYPVALVLAAAMMPGCASDKGTHLAIAWKDNYLTVSGDRIPGGAIRILYLEAFCRDDSHAADWIKHTVIGHTTEPVSAGERTIRLRSTLEDGVIVDHRITAGADEVDFRLVARNPTDTASAAHWAQPCIRVGAFTGCGPHQTDDKYAYVPKSFVFQQGRLQRMPTRDWASAARYTPGQVWAAPGVNPADVNPRPLNPHRPSNGLIGCFSADETMIMATAWQPYQELFQGVIRCLHSDFRLGGLKPGEVKTIRGTLYIVPADIDALLRRYRRDFPEHEKLHGGWVERDGAEQGGG